jgi:DNA-directed RNA polymerase subunit RPC12/RpoP
MMLDLWQEVLLSISRLCDRRSFTGPTVEDVIADLEQRYGRKYSRRSIEEAISLLESRGLVYRKRGLLRDGRVTLLTTKEPERVALTLIRLGEKEALVHNGWEGIVYDPIPSNGFSQTTHNEHLAITLGLILTCACLYWWASHLPKLIAKWTCIDCGRQVSSGLFNDVFPCPYCGKKYFVTIDKVWTFPFSSLSKSVIPKLTFSTI